jgi:hypothetical protein
VEIKQEGDPVYSWSSGRAWSMRSINGRYVCTCVHILVHNYLNRGMAHLPSIRSRRLDGLDRVSPACAPSHAISSANMYLSTMLSLGRLLLILVLQVEQACLDCDATRLETQPGREYVHSRARTYVGYTRLYAPVAATDTQICPGRTVH